MQTEMATATAATASGRTWSAQQIAIFEWFRHGTGHAVVRARAGCLSADTVVNINRAGRGWSLPIAELAAKFNGQPHRVERSDGRVSATRGWDPDVSTFIQQERDGVIRLGRIADVWCSGEKPTFRVQLADGKVVRATDEHPFFTEDGWRPLARLRAGMGVCVRGDQKLNGPAPKKTYPTLSGMWHHPFATKHAPDRTHRFGVARVPLHRLVVEAAKNGLSLEEFLNRVFAGQIEGLWFIDPGAMTVHHRDRNPQNNAIANLDLMTIAEHHRLHSRQGTDENVLFKADFVPVVAVQPARREATFDVSIDDEFPHNFIANGVVVHNTGKTTTIVEAIGHAPERRILLAAFNKRIQEELAGRILASNPNAVAQTLHSIGFAAVRQNWPGIFVAKPNKRAFDLADRVCGEQSPLAIRKMVAKLHTKAREIAPHATTPGDLLDLAVDFECVPDDEWVDAGYDLAYVTGRAIQAMELAASQRPIHTGIDYSDMIYLPIRNRWLRRQFDLVVVDEAQDMSASQLEIAQGVAHGRIVVVGDDRQAIYGFRGADSGSLDRLKGTLQATEFGLTVTYRCGRAIVDRAARIVPDFQAAPSNPAGEVRPMFERDLIKTVQPGDFVLSRKNAPLAGIAMKLIRAQTRVRVAGRDIGAGLLALVQKHSKGLADDQVADFLGALSVWADGEIAKAMKLDREDRIEQISDQLETMIVLSDGVAGLRELAARIDSLFTDNGLGAAGFVTCSSVHKAKGLEADRVFVLADTLVRGFDLPPARAREEANIEYVAITRAKSVLFWVLGDTTAAATPAPQAETKETVQ